MSNFSVKDLNNNAKKKSLNGFSQRLLSEQRFHDFKYVSGNLFPPHYKLHPTYRIFTKMKEKLGNVSGKRILEYGCGDGWGTAELASLGGVIDSFDISGEAVKNTNKFLERLNLTNRCSVREMAGERLDYPDNTFEIAIGFAILHHLDLPRAMPELLRVMKPAGVTIFAEPLGSNPFLNIYRKLTPQYRTPDEKPLIIKDFLKYTKGFTTFCHEEHFLFALLGLAFWNFTCIEKTSARLFDHLTKIDDRVLKSFPALGKYAWYSILTFVK